MRKETKLNIMQIGSLAVARTLESELTNLLYDGRNYISFCENGPRIINCEIVIPKMLKLMNKYSETKRKTEKKYSYGIHKYYKAGDIVVWKGQSPCIGRIKSIQINDADCWEICESHDSLHYTYLRYAKPSEIKKLGKKQMILL